MTIDDQIRNENLQREINREASKISVSSSGKIEKYQYLTAEEILPYNEKQIAEQAKFTYSPLGKASEKQIKTIEDQRKKQVDALEALKPIKHNKSDDNEKLKYKKKFDELCNERISKNVDFDNLTYCFKSPNIAFNKFYYI